MQPEHRCGLWRAQVTAVNSTTSLVKVMLPDLYGGETGWIPSAVASLPAVGAQVWVSFEKGDENYPVVVGPVTGNI